jgi:TonB family protein
MPTLTPTNGRRVPLVPSRRVQRARNALAWAGGMSLGLHALIIVALIVQFPDTPPQEAPAAPSVDVVFESGAKKATAPAVKKGVAQQARQAAPKGEKATEAPRVAQAAPRPEPTPPPPIPFVKPTPPPKPAPQPPQPKPVEKPVPSPPPKPAPLPPRPMPPAPPLPVVKLPPPLPAPPVPAPPIPAPAPPAPPPPPSVDTSQAQMNVPMPTLPPFSLPMLPPPPLPLPPAPPQPTRTAQRNPSRSRSALGGTVMNGMSFNGGGSLSGGTGRGLNTSLGQAEQVDADPTTVLKGDVGSDWIATLDKWVQDNTYYPPFAAENGQQGDVLVQFTVERDGTVSRFALVNGSHYPLLNQAFLGIFRNAKVPPLPTSMKDNQAIIQFKMQFVLIH